jgi:hypothetical protein
MTSLLDQFLIEEATQEGHIRIQDALARQEVLHRLSFNRFDITIDHEKSSVAIEDVTDASPTGSEILALPDFVARFVAKPR